VSSKNNLLRPDAHWDGQGSASVRCSSVGKDAMRYHDPSRVGGFETNAWSGRSVASLLPGGPRGVIIPRATHWGGSRGFDPQQPLLMNVDPDIKGQASVVDYSKFSKEEINAAYALAWEQVGDYGDPRLIAAQTWRNLCVDTEPVGMSNSEQPLEEPRLAPVGGLDTYVVPKAAPGGGQVRPLRALPQPVEEEFVASPSVAPVAPKPPKSDPISVMPMDNTRRQAKESAKEASEMLRARLGLPSRKNWDNQPAEQEPALRKQAAVQPIVQQVQPVVQHVQPIVQPQPQQFVQEVQPQYPQQQPVMPMQNPFDMLRPNQQAAPAIPITTQAQIPTEQVIFERQGWGQMPATYHKVIRNGILLVLKWDQNCRMPKYFPPASDSPIGVYIHGSRSILFVQSAGTTFVDDPYEYCILVVTGEQPIQPQG